MRKVLVFVVLLVVLAIGSVAHAALFTFDDDAGRYLGGASLVLTDAESGLVATFDGFTVVDNMGILTDFVHSTEGGLATISFNRQVHLDSLDMDILGTSHSYDISFFSHLLPSKDLIDMVMFSLDAGALLGINSVEVSPTPIPGAVWLLGSGLVGLVGLRRRFQV